MSGRPRKRRRISSPKERRSDIVISSDSDSSLDVSITDSSPDSSVELLDTVPAPVADPLSDAFRINFAAFLLNVPYRMPRRCEPLRDRRRWRWRGVAPPAASKRPNIHPDFLLRKRFPFLPKSAKITSVDGSSNTKPMVRANVGLVLESKIGRKTARTMASRILARQDCEDVVRRLLKMFTVKALREFLRDFCREDDDETTNATVNKLRSLGQDSLLYGLTMRFCSGVWPQEKREEEERVLAEMGGVSQMSQGLFFQMSGVTLARDAVIEILSFMAYDYQLICSIGLANWDWYALVLSTWRAQVKIQKANLFTIPNVVLSSAKKFCLTKGSVHEVVRKASRFTIREITVAFEKIFKQCTQIEELSIDWNDFKDLTRRLKCLKKVVSKNSELLLLRRLEICRGSLLAFHSIESLPKIRFVEFAPRVEEIVWCVSLEFCIGLAHLRKLTFLARACEFGEDLAQVEQALSRVRELAVNFVSVSPAVTHLLVGVLPKVVSFSFSGSSPSWTSLCDELSETVLDRLSSLSVEVLSQDSWKRVFLRCPNLRRLCLLHLPSQNVCWFLEEYSPGDLRSVRIVSGGWGDAEVLEALPGLGLSLVNFEIENVAKFRLTVRPGQCRLRFRTLSDSLPDADFVSNSGWTKGTNFYHQASVVNCDPGGVVQQLFLLVVRGFMGILDKIDLNVVRKFVGYYVHCISSAAEAHSKRLEVVSQIIEASPEAYQRMALTCRLTE